MFEALEDAGWSPRRSTDLLPGAAREHRPTLPGLTRTVLGPRRFFYYSLFESDATGAPLAVRRRAAGTHRRVRGRGRPLAGHARRLRLLRLLPLRLRLRLARARARRARAGSSPTPTGRSPRCSRPPAGPTPFSSAMRWSSAPTTARPGSRRRAARGRIRRPRPLPAERPERRRRRPRLEPRRPGLPAAALRASRVRELAERLDRRPEVDAALFLEDGEAVARRDGEELRFRAAEAAGSWRATPSCSTIRTRSTRVGRRSEPERGRRARLGRRGLRVRRPRRPQPRRRRQPRLAASPGTRGADARRRRWTPSPAGITGVMPAVLAHFGVEPPPPSAR